MASFLARLALLLLLSGALAGCASNDADPEADVGADDGDASGSDGDETETTTTPNEEDEPQGEEPADRLGRAFSRIDNAPGHFRANLVRYDASLSRVDAGMDTLYVDSANHTTYYRFHGKDDDRVGQVGNVVIHMQGGNDTVYAVRAEFEPFTTVGNFSQLALGAQLPIALAYYPSAQYMFMQRVYHVPSFGNPTVEDDPSAPDRTRFVWGQTTGTSTTVVLEDGTDRIFWLNATQAVSGRVEKWGNASFDHGVDAANDAEVPKMARAASMALFDEAGLDAAQRQEKPSNKTTWTIMSSQPALVPLAEAELRVTSLGGVGKTPSLALPLEDGSASNADFALAFEDVDGDGKVSSGDTFTWDVKRTGKNTYDYALRLSDETTGWELVAR